MNPTSTRRLIADNQKQMRVKSDCVDGHRSPWFVGEYGFVLRNAKPLPFIPYKGALGFFGVPESVVTP